MSTTQSLVRKHTVVIVGAGAGGIAVAAQLRRADPGVDVVIVDPAAQHYYQPAWTLVGGGAYAPEATRRSLTGCLPAGVVHVASAVKAFLPDESQIECEDGTRLGYEYLVVAAGIQVNWDAVEGLVQALGKNGVTSNYRYDLAPYTWQLVREFKGGHSGVYPTRRGGQVPGGAAEGAVSVG